VKGGVSFKLPRMKTKLNKPLLFLFFILYVACFTAISIKKFLLFGFHDFDLAVHDLTVWNILHGGSIYNSILGVPFLGNHMNIILFLIAPIYALFQHPLTLLFIQTIALGGSVFPLYLFARRILDDKWAMIIAIVYLLYPALAYTNLFEFHPQVLATFFLFICIYCYAAGSFTNFIISAFFAMFCQENIPFAVAMFGIVALFEKRALRWVLIPVLAAIIYFTFAMMVMPHMNRNILQFFSLYNHLGVTPGKIVLNIFSRPDLVAHLLARQECLAYVMQLFLPLAFIPLFGLVILLPILPFFLQHAFSIRGTELTIYYHYAAEIIPFIFAGLVYGIRFLLKRSSLIRPLFLKIALISAVIIGNLYFGPYFKIPQILFSPYHKGYLDQIKYDLLAKVPENSGVVATFEFLPHLTHRKYLYSMHHVYTGHYTLSKRRYELPDNAEYALIDFNDFTTFGDFYSRQGYRNLQFLGSGNWGVEDFSETIVLFKKKVSSLDHICQKISGSDFNMENRLGITVDNSIELLGFTLNDQTAASLDMVFFWKSLKQTWRDIGYMLEISAKDGTLLARKFRPICYRIFPVNSWKEGEFFKERMRLKLPLALEKYNFKITFFDNSSGFILKEEGPVIFSVGGTHNTGGRSRGTE